MSRKLITKKELADQKERRRQNQARWRQRHPDKVKEKNARWRAENPKKSKLGYLRRKLRIMYNLSIEEYKTMLIKQKGRCAICGRLPKKNKRLSVDHDHSTGKVRGLLCVTCNFALGYMLDNPQLLRKAASYLIKHTKNK